MENTKMRKSAAVVDRVLKIVQGFMTAGEIVCAIFIPLTLIFGQKVVANADSVSMGGVQLHLIGDPAVYLDLANLKFSIVAMLVAAIFTLAASWYCLRVLRQILVPMKAGQPFARGVSGQVRKLGWTVLVAGGIAEISRAVGAVLEMRAYQVETLMDSSVVADVTANYQISLWFVVTALILFFLSYVFRYGEALQQESDETL